MFGCFLREPDMRDSDRETEGQKARKSERYRETGRQRERQRDTESQRDRQRGRKLTRDKYTLICQDGMLTLVSTPFMLT